MDAAGVILPLRSAWSDAYEDTPLFLRVYPVINDLGVLQICSPVKDLLWIRGPLQSTCSYRLQSFDIL